MGRAAAWTSTSVLCLECAHALGLESALRGDGGSLCDRCGAELDDPHAYSSERAGSPSIGHLGLIWRGWILRLIELVFWTGTFAGAVAMLVCGGFVPVARAWLRNELSSWADVVSSLGGIWFRVSAIDPDSDLGPVLARVDAPMLFATVDAVGRRLGVQPPGQIRLTYLPCCGVVAWRRSRALLIGLPLFRVLSQRELRAVVAHELAHLARGDATRAARSARFVETLGLELERSKAVHGPLGFWARFLYGQAAALIEPVAWGQETRADRSAAAIAGGPTAASALVKVALVQPLFKELLDAFDPIETPGQNLYALFRGFWYRLPPDVHSAMRLTMLTTPHVHDPAHPPLSSRISVLQSYPDPPNSNGDAQSASTFLGDLEIFEHMLHNRLFSLVEIEPSIFHRNGT